MLRVIAGEFRGRRLVAPEGEATRPIMDRQKQSLFDILAPRFPMEVVVDVFAGSGSLGIEALSRGAAKVVFVEKNRHALPVLRRNLEELRILGRTSVVAQDAFAVDPASFPPPVELVFMDPPFPVVREDPGGVAELARRLVWSETFAEAGLLILRTPMDGPTMQLSPTLRALDERQFGESRVTWIERSDSIPTPAPPFSLNL